MYKIPPKKTDNEAIILLYLHIYIPVCLQEKIKTSTVVKKESQVVVDNSNTY